MKFAVETVTKHSGRIGRLTKIGFESKTPLVLHYTKVASIPHLSREMLDIVTTDPQGIQVSIETTSLMQEAVSLFQKGIAAFAGLDHTFTFVTLKDTGATKSLQHSCTSVAITTRGGKTSITPEKYMNMIEAFKPDFFHTLCDGDTNENSPNKRIFNAVNRTDGFYRNCVSLYKSSPGLSDSMLIAPVEGGFNKHHRETSIKMLHADENQHLIGGYFLDGFHSNGESATQIDATKMNEIVEGCIALLPENKLKVMFGAYSPVAVLQLIQLGVDVFDTTYAYLATSRNQALTFSFDVENDVEHNQFAIDLTDSKYKDEFEPFVKGCQCLACRNHTRAYTEHLINTQELLSSILIMIHNTHHYLEFFKAIRRHTESDTLPTLLALISKQQSVYDSEQSEAKEKNAEQISSISTESPFKKLKNVDCD